MSPPTAPATSQKPDPDGHGPISHIAAAIDPYPEGRDAAVLGAMLAQATGAEMMLLAVEPDLPLLIPGLDRKRMREETKAMLAQTRSALAPDARLIIETDLSVPRGIHRAVRDQHRDLVVVGSSRRGPEGEVSIGRRTRQLLDELTCALAIAPRGLSAQPTSSLGRIGVGYDAGPEAHAALVLAAGIAARCGAELTIRGVVDDRIPALGWPNVWLGAIMESWLEVITEEAAQLLGGIETAAAALGVEAHMDVQRGRPSKSLLELSADVDLLVVGSRRWGSVARLLLGGTGEALVRGARCSMLIVPRPPKS